LAQSKNLQPVALGPSNPNFFAREQYILAL
jgi:hypothetical protein